MEPMSFGTKLSEMSLKDCIVSVTMLNDAMISILSNIACDVEEAFFLLFGLTFNVLILNDVKVTSRDLLLLTFGFKVAEVVVNSCSVGDKVSYLSIYLSFESLFDFTSFVSLITIDFDFMFFDLLSDLDGLQNLMCSLLIFLPTLLKIYEK